MKYSVYGIKFPRRYIFHMIGSILFCLVLRGSRLRIRRHFNSPVIQACSFCISYCLSSSEQCRAFLTAGVCWFRGHTRVL